MLAHFCFFFFAVVLSFSIVVCLLIMFWCLLTLHSCSFAKINNWKKVGFYRNLL
jgi:hypothetical protein